MSTASYETFVTARGTKEEYLSLLRCLRTYADDRARQYREKKDCWYLGDMWNGRPAFMVDYRNPL